MMVFEKNIRQLPVHHLNRPGLITQGLPVIPAFVFLVLCFSLFMSSSSHAAVDKYDDLAIGIPGESIGSVAEAGGVGVLYGNSTGLSAEGRFDDQFWSKGDPSIDGNATENEAFGLSLTNGDFNGDGFQDLVIGVPYGTVDGVEWAGSVHVIYGGAGGLNPGSSQVWNGNSAGLTNMAEYHDTFGDSLAAGDFNGDGFDDLAIGIPGKNVTGSVPEAGAVQVLYGSVTGLAATGTQIWHQDVPGIDDVPGLDRDSSTGDKFGTSLVAGDFNKDGFQDLAIGVPGRYRGCHGGVVNIIYGSSTGLTATGNQIWSQGFYGILGDCEDFDKFGSALAARDFNGDGFVDLAISDPKEDIGGCVNIIYGSSTGLTATGNQVWSQDSEGIEGGSELIDRFGSSLAAGDFNGDGFGDLAIGVPYESIGAIDEAGGVNVIYGSSAGLASAGNQFWNQNMLTVTKAEGEDRFGRALATGDFNGDGFDDLAVGTPYEGVTTVICAGLVQIIFGSAMGLAATENQYFRQGIFGVREVPEYGDLFGFALAAGKFGKPEGLIFLPLLIRN